MVYFVQLTFSRSFEWCRIYIIPCPHFCCQAPDPIGSVTSPQQLITIMVMIRRHLSNDTTPHKWNSVSLCCVNRWMIATQKWFPHLWTQQTLKITVICTLSDNWLIGATPLNTTDPKNDRNLYFVRQLTNRCHTQIFIIFKLCNEITAVWCVWYQK